VLLVNIVENPDARETKVTIECRRADENILQLLERIKQSDGGDKRIIGVSNGETYCIERQDILYFEAVDRKTFCYTEGGVYETAMRLYEVQEQLGGDGFIRISKSAAVNLNRIKSLRPDFGGRILATMENGEKIYVSRQYVPVFKKKLGIGEKS